jgi:hypothetical protein
MCAAIASCSDFDNLVALGASIIWIRLDDSPPLIVAPVRAPARTLNSRIDPVLFELCVESWIATLWPDGKTSWRTHDPGERLKALRALSAYSSQRWIGPGSAQRAGKPTKSRPSGRP